MIDIINVQKTPYLLNITKPAATKTVIFSHGFLSNKNRPYITSTATTLKKAGIKSVRFNYRTELVSERRAILHQVIRHVSKESNSIGLVGHSLGGLITLLEANNPLIKSIALINTVYNPPAVIKRYENKHRVIANLLINKLKTELIKHDLRSIAKTITKPVLVISSERDQLTLPSEMKQLYLDVKGPKKLVTLKKCAHSIWNPVHVQRVKDELREWFKETL